MRQVLIFIGCSFWMVGATFGQDFWLLQKPDSSNWFSKLEFNLDGDVRSNALENQFIDLTVFGGQINSELKNNMRSNLSPLNRFGVMTGATLRYSDYHDTLFAKYPNIGLTIQVGQRLHADLQFSEDLFDLAFFGNANHLGETMDLSLSGGQALAWQKFGFGFFDKKTQSSAIFSMVAGQQFYRGKITDGEFYTSANADTVSTNISGDYFATLAEVNSFRQYGGLGVSVDLKWNKHLEDNCGYFEIKLEDLGFAMWRGETTTVNGNSTFTGLELNDLFDQDNPLVFPDFSDSLGVETKEERRLFWLPARFSSTLYRSIRDHNMLSVGLMVIPVPGFLPQVSGGYHQYVKPNLLVGGLATLGGFGRPRVGFAVQWKPSASWTLKTGSQDVLGLFLNENRGIGGYFGLDYFIKSKND